MREHACVTLDHIGQLRSSACGAASLAYGAIATARAAGCTGIIIVRADSAYYAAEVVAAIRRQDARFSVTARMNSSVKTAIAGIAPDLGRWIQA